MKRIMALNSIRVINQIIIVTDESLDRANVFAFIFQLVLIPDCCFRVFFSRNLMLLIYSIGSLFYLDILSQL